MTLARLAARATKALSLTPAGRRRGGSVSISYLSLIENGRKVPDESVAVAVARALGDDVRIHRAWVRARKRCDLDAALAAAETLQALLRPSAAPAPRSEAATTTRRAQRARSGSMPVAEARLRVPVIAGNAEPGDGIRPSCDVIEWLRLELDTLDPDDRERLDRPFAYRLDADAVRRVPETFAPGDVGLVLRKFMPISSGAFYAIRIDGQVVLSRALWNGSSLLLLPAEGESDFIVVDIGSETLLGRHVVGRVVAPHRTLVPPSGSAPPPAAGPTKLRATRRAAQRGATAADREPVSS